MIDLTGQRFERLSVVKMSPTRKWGKIFWECRCDCGTTRTITTSDLRSGHSRSCGCLARETTSRIHVCDLCGTRSGRLLVITRDHTKTRKSKEAYWACQCDCGKQVVVRGADLRGTRATRSCGCLKNEKASERSLRNLQDLRFGRLMVRKRVANANGGAVRWECDCDCGKVTVVRAHQLTTGRTQSCGCLRGDMIRRAYLKDLTGQEFGYLRVIERAIHPSGCKRTHWKCLCVCGNTTLAVGNLLRKGIRKSCGCRHETKYGKIPVSKLLPDGSNWQLVKAHNAWMGMKARCYNSRLSAYPYYGGRGISVYSNWQESFTAFVNDVGFPPTPQHSLDRIAVNGNYEPTNVRWATDQEQVLNRRSVNELQKEIHYLKSLLQRPSTVEFGCNEVW
jgi:hypothetical protein